MQIPEKAKDKYCKSCFWEFGLFLCERIHLILKLVEADIEDISFEKLLEIEKKAEEEEKMRLNSSSSNTIESDSGRDNSKAAKGNKPSNSNKPNN